MQVDSVPPHVTARTRTGNLGTENQPKGHKASEKFAASTTREVDLNEIEQAESPKKGKSKKAKKNAPALAATSTVVCDDSSGSGCLDCDDPSDPRCHDQVTEAPAETTSTSSPVDATSPPADAQIVDTGRSSANSQVTTFNGRKRNFGFGSARKNTTSTTSTSAPTSGKFLLCVLISIRD